MYSKRAPRKNGKFVEYQSYSFELLKIIEISADEKYYAFLDTFGTRHLISFELYKDYGFKVGEKINAYIDKISCTGKVYIEPEHPFYKVNSVHEFECVGRDKRYTKEEKWIDVILVRDKDGRIFTVLPEAKMEELPKKIACKVQRVKKTRLYLKNVK